MAVELVILPGPEEPEPEIHGILMELLAEKTAEPKEETVRSEPEEAQAKDIHIAARILEETALIIPELEEQAAELLLMDIPTVHRAEKADPESLYLD